MTTKEMNEIETELIMLGTGNATVTKCYNTVLSLKRKRQCCWLMQGGKWNFKSVGKVDVPIDSIHDMFVTHAHTDHILGAVWMIRIIAQWASNGHYSGRFRVYGHDKVLMVLDQICRMTLPVSVIGAINKYVEFCDVKHGDTLRLGDLNVQFFDIASTKEKTIWLPGIIA